MVTNYGRGGGYKTGGGSSKVLPLHKKGGGAQEVVAMLKGAGGVGTTSFEVVLTQEF